MEQFPNIPGFDLLEHLGGGPLTCAYRAHETSSGQSCVVKTLRETWEDRPTAIKLIQREARAGLMVQHQHLVRTLYAHVMRPPYYLVLEWLPGATLRTALQEHGRLDLERAVCLTRQVAQALFAVHRAGFIHGDVKPENIQVLQNGSPKLIDLGFAHRPGENTSLLAEGYLLGTGNYLAPERCAVGNAVDHRSDLYSLGVMLYEMLTGRLPFPAGTLKETLVRHQVDRPADPRLFTPELPDEMLAILESLLARSPQERAADARALVQRLVAFEVDALRKQAA